MEREKKIVKRTKKVREYALKDGDWYTLGKFYNEQDKRLVKAMDEDTRVLYDALAVNQMLICDLYESMGKNPMDHCSTLVYYYVYLHGSLESCMPGARVVKGKVYDWEGKEIPYPELYAAREEGKTFNEALNEQYHRNHQNAGIEEDDDGYLTEKKDGD